MKRRMLIVPFILLSALLSVTAVWAQQDNTIGLKLVAEVEIEVINDKGEAELKRVPAARVVPGDQVIYTIYYANAGKEPTDNVAITNPVPEHMSYLEGSASGADTVIIFSVDDGKTYDLPAKLTITGANGKKRPAKGSDYTHIRWTLQKSLAPEKKGGYVNFRARLE